MAAEHVKMLDALLALEEGLTAWEVEFVDDLDRNWRDRELSDKQARALAAIYEKRC